MSKDNKCINTYLVRDDTAENHEEIVAETREDAAHAYISRGWYAEGDDKKTYWVDIIVTEIEPDDKGDYPSTTYRIAIDPEEPACAGSKWDHDFESKLEIVGGTRETPGVYTQDGGVVSRTVCTRCGWHQIRHVWESDPANELARKESLQYELHLEHVRAPGVDAYDDGEQNSFRKNTESGNDNVNNSCDDSKEV